MTTTPAPLCNRETRPFVHAGDMLCVPNNVHPVGELTELSKCGSQCTFWLETNKMMFKTGGPCTCERLDLSNKGIAKIANGTVSDMPNLRDLRFQSNEIVELEPGWLSNLTSLHRLNLSYNKIASLEPGWVSNVPNLQVLILSGNKIAQLKPGWVSNVPNLKFLWIFDNPLGCVSGFADDVEIDDLAMDYGFYETPRCPENCTINTTLMPVLDGFMRRLSSNSEEWISMGRAEDVPWLLKDIHGLPTRRGQSLFRCHRRQLAPI